MSLFDRTQVPFSLCHPDADLKSKIPGTTSVGRWSIVASGVRVGQRCVIGDNVIIRGGGTKIGDEVTIGDRATVGSRCVLHKGAIVEAGATLPPRTVLESGATWTATGPATGRIPLRRPIKGLRKKSSA